MKIIINADDFGMTHTKNVAINELMCKGVCSNASLVVNSPYTEEAAKMAIKGGYADKISLHINLTEGTPLTEKIKKNSLYSRNNEFVHRPIITKIRQVLPIHVGTIRQEVEAQIIRFSELGFDLRGIDSHNWVHLRLPVWLAILPLIKKYDIKIVRPMWKGYRRADIASKKWARYFRIIEPIILHTKQCRVMKHTSNIEQFLLIKDEIKEEAVVEVFTHPDFVGDKIMDMSSSYLKRERKCVEENVKQLCDYNIVSINNIVEGKRI